MSARKSLMIWPVVGPDLADAAIAFMVTRLTMKPGRIDPATLKVTELQTGPDSSIKSQVLVEFPSVRLRDEVKALARNLKGSADAGIQMEVPDFLRGRFQTFQSLAFEMKKKNPALRRNIKFLDAEMELVMDVKLNAESDWKTVQYEDASAILPTTRGRTQSISRTELAGLIVCEKSDDASDIADDTLVDLTEDENITEKNYSRHSLSFINTNARSLGPKVESLLDCMHEKSCDLAMVTETWYQDNRAGTEEIEQYAARFSLGSILRNRTSVSSNGRQYGGVAFFFRLASSSFKEFPLINPEDHEILATIGTVKGIKGKVFCITAYSPPNITLLKARQMHEFISDVLDEAKRQFPECTIILAGDFNHWPIEESVEDHLEILEIPHGNTRGSRAIDRSFCNFSRSLVESGTLPPLETDDGRSSDHRIAYAKAVFTRPKEPTVTYTYRHYTEEGAERFRELIGQQSWDPVFNAIAPSGKVVAFQNILDYLMSLCFAMKTTTK